MENHEIPYIIELPRIQDPRGNLSFVQNGHSFLPFEIQRAYWIYDVPAGEERGSHSHIKAQSLIIAAGGSFNGGILLLTDLFKVFMCHPAIGARLIISRQVRCVYPLHLFRTAKRIIYAILKNSNASSNARIEISIS